MGSFEEQPAAAKAVAIILGEELRNARARANLTRDDAVADLTIKIPTLLAYEHGKRDCTVVRLFEMCDAWGVDPALVVHIANVRRKDPTMYGFIVDLRELISDPDPEWVTLQTWARRRSSESRSPFVELSASTVREMATLLDIDHGKLASYLLYHAAHRVELEPGARPSVVPESKPTEFPDEKPKTPTRKKTQRRRPEPTTRLREGAPVGHERESRS